MTNNEVQGATNMFTEIRRIAVAAVGALFLTTTFVGAAVAPAHVAVERIA